jgi:type II secretory pathway component PulM
VSTGEKYVAAAYGVFLVFVLIWIAIIATKLARLERDSRELVALARERRGDG